MKYRILRTFKNDTLGKFEKGSIEVIPESKAQAMVKLGYIEPVVEKRPPEPETEESE